MKKYKNLLIITGLTVTSVIWFLNNKIYYQRWCKKSYTTIE